MYTQITGLKDCYGCGVCAAVCPVRIIDFGVDAEGFYRPSVTDGDRCIRCGLCSGSCAALGDGIAAGTQAIAAYAAYADDPHTRRTCSSGGIAYSLAADTVAAGGAFCGVRYDAPGRRAEHYVATDAAGLDDAKGSKYIQSDSTEGLREALHLRSGRTLVTGTPCQIASVRKYLRLRGEQERYLLADFYCHGVPSLNLWHKYVAEREDTLGAADTVRFRDKSHGWHKSLRITGLKGGATIYSSGEHDTFLTFFLRNYVSMARCYTCPLRGDRSAADIRLGDMWGAKYAADDDGVSAAVAMTEKGRRALESLECVTLIPESMAVANEGQITCRIPRPPQRTAMLEELKSAMTLDEIYAKHQPAIRRWRRLEKIRKLWNRKR